jgi:hypothetical protein
MLPADGRDAYVSGTMDLNQEQIDVLDLEKAIAAGALREEEPIPAAEELS